uniref:GDSL esterase/lipase At5g03610 family n=2 Tax=Cajanus cajan TaxID=3821 RepID=A0A151TVP8_CAJCA|nr:GDSL esterase/lipase At5g03610 family [Cajanus cajan]
MQAEARHHHHHHHHHLTKLFVFGDSYADTGNVQKSVSTSWKDPYGITFPGKPAGRFSDGRVLTDFIAKHLKVKSPIPYRLRKVIPNHLKYGMNFAFGGSGVFKTSFPLPNMTTQIDFFQQLIEKRVYSALDLTKSVALVSVAGNDYSYYLATNGSAEGLPAYVGAVVSQTVKNLIRIKGLGVKKIVVGGLQPLGCLPSITVATSYERCNETTNALVLLHNSLLSEAVSKLNKRSMEPSTFLVLNLYESFLSVLKQKQKDPSTHHIGNKLKPCCVGVSSGYTCGDVDKNKVKMYRVCDDPKSAFFWDLVHPTQAGWHAVYNKLRTMNTLQHIHFDHA